VEQGVRKVRGSTFFPWAISYFHRTFLQPRVDTTNIIFVSINPACQTGIEESQFSDKAHQGMFCDSLRDVDEIFTSSRDIMECCIWWTSNIILHMISACHSIMHDNKYDT
jgi:hypothetical protein